MGDQNQMLQSLSSGLRIRNSNPLQIKTVLECLFGYLDLGNLKECRRVNKMWNTIAEPLLRKHSKIIFGHNKVGEDGERVASTPKEFLEDFSSSETTAKFTSFHFLPADYPVSEVDDFFEKHKRGITNLEINGINLINEDGKKVETHDISSWIKDSKIVKFSIKKCRNFSPSNGTVHRPSTLVVSLNHLNSAEHLQLRDCNIIAEPGIKISPMKLRIGNVTISQNGKNLVECQVNDFIAFKKGTKFWMHTPKPGVTSTSLILNFGVDFIANEITLTGNTRIINWRMSKSSIGSLTMQSTPVLNKTGMKFRSLLLANASVDFAVLPKEVEKLVVVCCKNQQVLCSEPIILSKLTFLTLDIWHAAALTHFVNCSNLVQLQLYTCCDAAENITFNLNLIPNSVKELKIFGLLRLDGQTEVEKLVIQHSSLSDATRILAQIQTKTLVLHMCLDKERINELNDEMVMFLQLLKGTTLYIGPIHSFTTLNIYDYVDKKSEYYVFQNQKGKAINATEFVEVSIFPANY